MSGRDTKHIARKLRKYGDRCNYCDEELWKRNFSIDHVVPTSLGGKDSGTNLVPSCRRCNKRKGDLTLDEFRVLFFLDTGYKVFAFEPGWPNRVFYPPHKRKDQIKLYEGIA